MKEKTHIAEAIDSAKEKAAYDDYVKNILSNKYILAHILQGTVEECKDMQIKEIIEMIDEVSIGSTHVHAGAKPDKVIGDITEDKESDEKTTLYDLRFHIHLQGKDKKIKLLINVEAQNKYRPGYDIVTRGIYYASRMISSQRNAEFVSDHYDDIKKVYSLWICTNVPQYAKNTITEYKIKQEKVFGNFRGKARYDILTVVFVCIGDLEKENTPRILSMLSTLFDTELHTEEKKNILEQEYQIPMTRNLGEEIDKMCNLSEGIEEKGIEKGIDGERIRQVKAKLGQNKTPEQIAEDLVLSLEEVNRLISTISITA